MSEQNSQRSVFFDEWIKSLREQYKYVIHNNDQVTLPSLTKVMHDVGFSEDELAQLRVEATMHVDVVGADYVPDLNVLDTPSAGGPHPAECLCPQCIPIDESQFDAEGQPLKAVDPEEANHEAGHVFPVAKIEASELIIENEPVEDDETPDPEVDDETPDPEVDDELAEDVPITFEDSLVEELATEEDDSDELETEDEPKDDPDAPKQISMF
jgi:hypothetical protein